MNDDYSMRGLWQLLLRMMMLLGHNLLVIVIYYRPFLKIVGLMLNRRGRGEYRHSWRCCKGVQLFEFGLREIEN